MDYLCNIIGPTFMYQEHKTHFRIEPVSSESDNKSSDIPESVRIESNSSENNNNSLDNENINIENNNSTENDDNNVISEVNILVNAFKSLYNQSKDKFTMAVDDKCIEYFQNYCEEDITSASINLNRMQYLHNRQNTMGVEKYFTHFIQREQEHPALNDHLEYDSFNFDELDDAEMRAILIPTPVCNFCNFPLFYENSYTFCSLIKQQLIAKQILSKFKLPNNIHCCYIHNGLFYVWGGSYWSLKRDPHQWIIQKTNQWFGLLYREFNDCFCSDVLIYKRLCVSFFLLNFNKITLKYLFCYLA